MSRKEETKNSGFATAGLVLGIIGACTSFIPIISALIDVAALSARNGSVPLLNQHEYSLPQS